jgi:hypothetical protein
MAAPTSSIIDPITSSSQAVDTNTRAARVTLYPNDVGLLGAYSTTVKSGIMAAGLAGAAPIVSFRWAPATNPTALCVIRKMKFSLYNLGTGFAPGDALFEWYVARSFTAVDTGGGAATLTTNNAKLRTSFATTQATILVSATATLTAGTRTKDANPFRDLQTVYTTTSVPFQNGPVAENEVYRAEAAEYPLVLAPNEGVVIEATVPATGTWTFYAGFDWEERLSFGAASAVAVS